MMTPTSPITNASRSHSFEQFYLENKKNDAKLEKFYRNCVADTNNIWHDENVFPHVPSDQYAVVLAYRYEDDQYKVCYFDGTNFIGMDDTFSFYPDIWTYLPNTPPEKT